MDEINAPKSAERAKEEQTQSAESVFVSMLGRFEIRAGDGIVSDASNRSMKMWAFLAYIILNRPKQISHEEFFELLRGGSENNENPVSALKTLLYRVRTFLAPVDPNGKLVISHRGSYCWNPNIKCVVDAEQFERLCKRAAAVTLSDDERIDLYSKALRLYRGNFLQKISGIGALWVIPLQNHYHTMYLQSVCSISALLERSGRFKEVEEYCSRALLTDPMNEKLYCLLISALLSQGMESAALERYKAITDILYRRLGVRPSAELRSLYAQTMKTQNSSESDLSEIFDDLREPTAGKGAFYCEYGFFREAYRLEARRASRLGLSVFIGLLTVSTDDGKKQSLKELSEVMDKLQACATGSLRKGDVVSKYSSSQFVIMLSALTFEDGETVMKRIIDAFYRSHRKSRVTIGYMLQQIEFAE